MTIDGKLREAFGSQGPLLPSNVAWRVRAKIVAVRLRKARSIAGLQSLVIAIAALAMAPLFTLAPGAGEIALSGSLPALPLAGVVVLVAVFAVDALVTARGKD